MVRFGTGDLTVFDDGPCPCGRTAARMLGWRGRADEVTKVRGMFIHPRRADEVVAKAASVARYQVIVGREGHQDTPTFRLELKPGTKLFTIEMVNRVAFECLQLHGGNGYMREHLLQ